jgi:hypothetical protein
MAAMLVPLSAVQKELHWAAERGPQWALLWVVEWDDLSAHPMAVSWVG